MAQNFGSGSAQGSILVTFGETCTGEVALADADGNVLLRFTPGKAYRSVVLSCAGLEVGQTYTVTAGDQSQSVTLESLIYGGSAMGGGSDLLKIDDALASVDDFVAGKL